MVRRKNTTLPTFSSIRPRHHSCENPVLSGGVPSAGVVGSPRAQARCRKTARVPLGKLGLPSQRSTLRNGWRTQLSEVFFRKQKDCANEQYQKNAVGRSTSEVKLAQLRQNLNGNGSIVDGVDDD